MISENEARSKACFIAANIIEGAANRLPQLLEQAAEAGGIPQEEMQQVIEEMAKYVPHCLRMEAVDFRKRV